MKTTSNYFFTALVAVVALVGCKEEQWDSAKWKAENEAYFSDALNSKLYEVWELPKGGTLLVKWIKKGPATGQTPEATDSILCHYRGSNKNSTVFDQTFAGTDPISTDRLFECRPKDLVPGFRYALTQMRVGDRCQVVIPSYLAYGDRNIGNGLILPYSTLHFEIALVEVVKL